MKILKEDAILEELPISFLTDMISKSWEEVGYLKDASEAIRITYKDTQKIEQLMQDLMDAYLVFIGQIELHMHEQEYINEPINTPAETEEVAKSEEPEEAEEAIAEPEEMKDLHTNEKEEIAIKNPSESNPADFKTADEERIDSIRTTSTKDPFEFFVDFDEPAANQPRLTDNDLYGAEDSEYEQLKLKSQLK